MSFPVDLQIYLLCRLNSAIAIWGRSTNHVARPGPVASCSGIQFRKVPALVSLRVQCPQKSGKSCNRRTHVTRGGKFFGFVADPVTAPDKQHGDRAKVGQGRCVMGRTRWQKRAMFFGLPGGLEQLRGQRAVAWLGNLGIRPFGLYCQLFLRCQFLGIPVQYCAGIAAGRVVRRPEFGSQGHAARHGVNDVWFDG